MKTREDLQRERSRNPERRETSFIGVGGALLIVLGGLGIWLFVTFADAGKVDPKPRPAAAVTGTSVMTDSLQCERLIEISRREGLVKGERIGNRVIVDEKRWAALPKEKRIDLIQYLACATFAGRGLDALDEGERVQVYSGSPRKLVAEAGKSRGAVFTLEY
ncbi:MAG: hypothetical protein QM690_16345 [Sphingobium sp.]